MKLANFLDVEPVALAVTAGLMNSKQVGVERLQLPEDTKTRAYVKEQIMSIRGLTRDERQALIQAYEAAAVEPSEVV